MKHLILGGGNLGKDLLIEINAQGLGSPELLTRAKGTDVRLIKDLLTEIHSKNPQVVWYCVGGGSVAEGRQDHPRYQDSVLLNLRVPVALSQYLNKDIKLVLFSTDYAADETRPNYPFANSIRYHSNYAYLKGQMEKTVHEEQRPFTTVVRVGSLYGVHKPLNTFPGKILKNFAFNDHQVRLPQNMVVPTPTRWLAHQLVQNFDKLCLPSGATREHCAPSGFVTVQDWGKFVLKELRDGTAFKIEKEFYDPERPLVSGLGNSLSEDLHNWYELWEIYFRARWFVNPELREQLPEALKSDS